MLRFVLIILSLFNGGPLWELGDNQEVVAGQSATIRFGRGRRPRGPTYARGTIRSLFEDQEQATQRTAYDVATRPPCRNLFWGRSFRNNSVCLCRQSKNLCDQKVASDSSGLSGGFRGIGRGFGL
jgi:hypothetical protein